MIVVNDTFTNNICGATASAPVTLEVTSPVCSGWDLLLVVQLADGAKNFRMAIEYRKTQRGLTTHKIDRRPGEGWGSPLDASARPVVMAIFG